MRPLLLLLLLACAHVPEAGLRRAETRWMTYALTEGDAAAANQALTGLAVLGPPALPLLPVALARAQTGDLERERLADLIEALGPAAVPAVEAALHDAPAWRDAGLLGLARLGTPGAEALMRLSRDPRLGESAFEQLRAAVAWAQHPWVEAGKRQRHPYLLPAASFTPIDLVALHAPLVALSCSLAEPLRDPNYRRAAEVLGALGDLSCWTGWFVLDAAHAREALDRLPSTGPNTAASGALVLGLLRDPQHYATLALPAARKLLSAAQQVPTLETDIVALLQSGSPWAQAELLSAMNSRRPGAAVVEAVLGMVALGPGAAHRQAALSTLASWHLDDPRAWALFVAALGEDDTTTRVATWGLSPVSPAHVAWLEAQACRPELDDLRRVTLLRLLSVRAPSVQAALVHLLDASDPRVRAQAIEALVLDPADTLLQVDSALSRRIFALLRRDPEPTVRATAARAVGRLAARQIETQLAIQALRQASADPSRSVANQAARELRALENNPALRAPPREDPAARPTSAGTSTARR